MLHIICFCSCLQRPGKRLEQIFYSSCRNAGTLPHMTKQIQYICNNLCMAPFQSTLHQDNQTQYKKLKNDVSPACLSLQVHQLILKPTSLHTIIKSSKLRAGMFVHVWACTCSGTPQLIVQQHRRFTAQLAVHQAASTHWECVVVAHQQITDPEEGLCGVSQRCGGVTYTVVHGHFIALLITVAERLLALQEWGVCMEGVGCVWGRVRVRTRLSLKLRSFTAKLFQNRNTWSCSVMILRASGGGRGTVGETE